MQPLLSVRDLKVRFSAPKGDVFALRGVDFDLRPGEILAIAGESGCGKTTAARALMGLLPGTVARTGSILFDGRELTALSDRQMDGVRGEGMAMVFQNAANLLDPTMKVGKQLAEALIIKKKLPRRQAERAALDMLSALGIGGAEDICRAYPMSLSGGMAQRAAIAAALLLRPKLLICDEPASALDVTVAAHVLEEIRALSVGMGFAVILITHDLSAAASFAGQLAVMYAGRIVEYGQTAEVFGNPAHAYTKALLNCRPSGHRGRLAAIPGAAPDLRRLVAGDAFAPRNPHARSIDFEREPPLTALSPAHFARIWPEEVCNDEK